MSRYRIRVAVIGEKVDADGKVLEEMVDQSTNWPCLNYVDFVDMQEALGHAIVSSTVALGRKRIASMQVPTPPS